MEDIKLTKYSKGAGCGCKIAPKVLDEILHTDFISIPKDKLIVGNSSKDDAAVYDLGNNMGLISTTDFFTPIVDDPLQFGGIAAANAISDVYAMGGTPTLAIAILGWPVNQLPAAIARQVIEGGKRICEEAGIPLAGGHSIDSPEPFFGLAVNGLIDLKTLKRNNTAQDGDLIYLTKTIGVGILATAEKKGILQKEHEGLAAKQMRQLNKAGIEFGKLSYVHAMTDVTGFGLLGHLIEMAEGSKLSATIDYSSIPMIPGIDYYTKQMCFPDNTFRNWSSYESKVQGITGDSLITLCDPRTNGGLLVSIDKNKQQEFEKILNEMGLNKFGKPIGYFTKNNSHIEQKLIAII